MSGAGKGEDPRFDGVLVGSRGIGLPAVRTLSDEYRDVAEPKDSSRVPPPEPKGIIRRAVDKVSHQRKDDASPT